MIAYNDSNMLSDSNSLYRYRMERERLIEEITQRVLDRISVSVSCDKNIEKAIDEVIEKLSK